MNRRNAIKAAIAGLAAVVGTWKAVPIGRAMDVSWVERSISLGDSFEVVIAEPRYNYYVMDGEPYYDENCQRWLRGGKRLVAYRHSDGRMEYLDPSARSILEA